MKIAYVEDILNLRTKFDYFYIGLHRKVKNYPAFIYVNGDKYQDEIADLKYLVIEEFDFNAELKYNDLRIFIYDGYEVAQFMNEYLPYEQRFWSENFVELEL